MVRTLNNFSAPSEDIGHITVESVDKQARLLRKRRSLPFYLHMKLKAALLSIRVRCIHPKHYAQALKRTELQIELKKTLTLCNYSKRLRKSWRSGCGTLVGLDEE